MLLLTHCCRCCHDCFRQLLIGQAFLCLARPKRNPALGEVVWGERDGNRITTQNPYVVLAYFPRDVGNNLVPVFKFDPELGIWKCFDHSAFHLDAVFFRHDVTCL